MYEKVCINERKAHQIMREFVANVTEISYTQSVLRTSAVDLSDEAFLEFFGNKENWEEETVARELRLCKQDKFVAWNIGSEKATYQIGYTLDPTRIYSHGSKQFREHFVMEFPSARGFSHITLSLLHELGHHATAEDMLNLENYDRAKIIEYLEKSLPKHYINYAYFLLPDETLATNWAIEWLKDPNNRKIAKAFEKKLFKYFKNRG